VAGAVSIHAQAGLAASLELGRGRCKSRVARNYERPLEGFPADRLPSRAELRYGPDGVRLRTLPRRRVALSGSKIGFEVGVSRKDSASGLLRHPRHLGWDVHLQQWSVDPQGRPRHLVRRFRWRLGTVRRTDGPDLTIRSRPGIYRFDFTIEGPNQRMLKSYRCYVRVLPRRAAVHIVTNGARFQAGDTVIGQIQNMGTVPVFLESTPYLRLERFQDDRWTEIQTGSGPMWGAESVLLAGGASACAGFPIPNEAGGRYRVSAEVEVSRRGRLWKGVVTKSFAVDVRS